MKLNFKARSWHTWVSVVLTLPVLMVGTTAVFLAHLKTLGTESTQMHAGWLPVYQIMASQPQGPDVRTALSTQTGRLWLGDGSQWERVVQDEAWSVNRRHDGLWAISLHDQGVLLSTDGRHWQADTVANTALAQLAAVSTPQPLTLQRLITDLHTGEAFLGQEAKWVWIDLVGGALCLLALTGVYLWWPNERRKAALAETAG